MTKEIVNKRCYTKICIGLHFLLDSDSQGCLERFYVCYI